MHFHLDEHIPAAIADGLRRRGIDVTTTVEADLAGASDLAHVQFAHRTSRVILSGDPDFLALAGSGVEHAGLVYCHQNTRTIGQMIDFLLLVDACMSPEDMRNHIEFA